MTNKSISQRLKEIDEEISALYQEKHMLEMEQQEYWRKMGWIGPGSRKYFVFAFL